MNQQEAMAHFMPQIEKGLVYEKFVVVEARVATPGERIDTITSDGKETTNVAKEGDRVVRNPTQAREQYIISTAKIQSRYEQQGDISLGGWLQYKAKGECQGIPYQGEAMEFVASWGENMVLKPGDMIVTPLPQKNEVYRIARVEFNDTYRLK